jgi:ribonucleotide monophosphatase NagD (HAD superfamily)
VGDKLDQDIGAAKRIGLDAALVLTGGTTREEADAANEHPPDRVAPDLASLLIA